MPSSKIYETLLFKTSMGFCLIDQDAVIKKCNTAFENIAGVTKPEGTKLGTLLINDGDLVSFINKALKDGSASLEVDFDRKESSFYAIANATLLEEKEDKTIAILFTGVNQRRDLEQQLEERIALEVKKNREKEEMMNQQAKLATMGEMIGNIAHQWRQPLNILALVFQDIYIKFQLGGLDADQMEKNYEKVNNLLQYMSQTIDDFRTFFKSEDGDAPFDVATALNSVFDLVGTRFSSNNTACEIEIQSSATVMGTENGFKQVVINLLNNAQEAILATSPQKGEIDITVSNEGDMVVVVVKDNGGGVPGKILNQIFEPYFTTKHKTQGTGLGLYMSKQIIEQHMAGKLEVSNDEKGAVFKISLPQCKSTEAVI